MHFQPIDNTGHDDLISHGGSGGGDVSPVQAMNDPLDDVFGADGDDVALEGYRHPSDMRRLETEHSTAGYREGIANGKDATLQEGFDQGYPLGAVIGLEAGQLLGLLEGICEAIRMRNNQPKNENHTRVEKLLVDARDTLSVDSIFKSEYWTGTGEPRYTIDVGRGETAASAHPLIRQWKEIVDVEIRQWAINRNVLAHVNPQRPKDLVSCDIEEHDQSSPQTRNPLDW